MNKFRRCLERQERETRERNRRADEVNELQRQVDEQVLIAVALQEERTKVAAVVHKSAAAGMWKDIGILGKNFFCDAAGVLGLLPEQKLTAVIRMLAYGASADQVDEIARMGKSTTLEALVRFCQAVETLYTRDYLRRPTPRDLQRLLQKAEARGFPGMIGSIDCMHWQWKNCPTAWQGDYGNRKGQKSIILEAGPNVTYEVNNTVYQTGYYLADGIYPRWTTFVKSIPNPRSQKQKLFATYQEGYRKDVERCFGILQARWLIIRGAARMFDEEILRSIMMTCIILHNMIVEDEYDYDALEVYEPDPMNTALTRIYERPMGPNGEPFEPEPLVRDGHLMTRMIDRYTEMQSSYIHEMRQVHLMEHLWAYGIC
ncbi:Protein kinase superfamily protein [Prunus dulcis]|uniref:Protein kinase superfamily protein n=1 Tax=Prunus dulcis TaxID=3755 RepID=A0A4Y1RDA4_PRUDU|nr:Protein kinase superfamily protein [Prunus dulcis]